MTLEGWYRMRERIGRTREEPGTQVYAQPGEDGRLGQEVAGRDEGEDLGAFIRVDQME